MKKQLILISLITFLSNLNISYSQKEFNNWYFGLGAGITFNTPTGEPVELLNGAHRVKEGCCTVSDRWGNLLFYIAGDSIFNRKHQLMKTNFGQNGGGYSSTQCAIAVQKPISSRSDTNIYYIFTCAENQTPRKGARYFILDLSLNNGLGDLKPGSTLLQASTSEKVAAYKHANGHDVWIVLKDNISKNYSSYLLTKDGIVSNPIISKSSNFPYINDAEVGQMKFSPNGKYLASAFYTGGFEILNFDNATGLLSNSIYISQINGNELYYGIEFSPNINLLYVSSFSNSGMLASYIYQLNLTNKSSASLKNSAVKIKNTTNFRDYFPSIELAPNGKIYITRPQLNYISSIENPNTIGTGCGYKENAVTFKSKNTLAYNGLPNRPILADYLYVTIDIPDTLVNPGEDLCMPVSVNLKSIGSQLQKLGNDIIIKYNYNPMVFRIYPNLNNIVYDTIINPRMRITSILYKNVQISDTSNSIFNVCGISLISDTLKTPLNATDLKLNNITVNDILVNNGSISLSTCLDNQRLITLLNQTKASIIISNQILTASLETEEIGTTNIKIFNIQGQELFYKSIYKANSSYEKFELPISFQYSSGLYYVSFQTPNQIITKTILKD